MYMYMRCHVKLIIPGERWVPNIYSYICIFDDINWLAGNLWKTLLLTSHQRTTKRTGITIHQALTKLVGSYLFNSYRRNCSSPLFTFQLYGITACQSTDGGERTLAISPNSPLTGIQFRLTK